MSNRSRQHRASLSRSRRLQITRHTRYRAWRDIVRTLTAERQRDIVMTTLCNPERMQRRHNTVQLHHHNNLNTMPAQPTNTRNIGLRIRHTTTNTRGLMLLTVIRRVRGLTPTPDEVIVIHSDSNQGSSQAFVSRKSSFTSLSNQKPQVPHEGH